MCSRLHPLGQSTSAPTLFSPPKRANKFSVILITITDEDKFFAERRATLLFNIEKNHSLRQKAITDDEKCSLDESLAGYLEMLRELDTFHDTLLSQEELRELFYHDDMSDIPTVAYTDYSERIEC